MTQAKFTTAVYPGTFDPMTLGHEHLMARASRLFDKLILAVAAAHHKRTMFTIDERMDSAREIAKTYGNIEVVLFRGLLRDFVVQNGGNVVVRGVRAISDFDYEFQMAGMNQQLNDRIETVFLMADVGLQPIASRLVKEIAIFGGDIHKFVTPAVRDAVVARISERGLRQGEG